MDAWQLTVDRADLPSADIEPLELPPLAAGSARLAVRSFALTANNITYGAAGDLIGYWNFFPASEGRGIIPVWGFADVVESEAEGVPVGQRVYGYFPMATHLDVEPGRVSPTGWVDAVEHRSVLPPVYNRYAVVPSERDDRDEDLESILRPLFTTSWLIDDFLADADPAFFGAEAVVLTSASSKTALGTAHCLARRGGVQVIGLTSPGNVDFVTGLGTYDTVVTYDDVESLPAVPTVAVDMAGNGPVMRRVHSHLGEALRHSSIVGMTHWEDRSDGAPLPGPQPQMFFAPTQVEQRIADWGSAGYQERLDDAWADFIAGADDWMEIEHHDGADATAAAFAEMVAGTVAPTRALIIRP